MDELKSDKILKYRVSNPNYIGYSDCTGKFETEKEAVSLVKNWFVDIMVDYEENWYDPHVIDFKINREEKDNEIIFKLTGKERITSGHIRPRKNLVTREIKPIKWEVVYE